MIGGNDVHVYRVPWADHPWTARCYICEMIRASRSWRGVYRWATNHAAEHAANRCEHCGRTS